EQAERTDQAGPGGPAGPTEPPGTPGTPAARREDRPFHLHLRNARMVTTTGAVPVDGAYMRIRLAEVAGWVIGDFNTTQPYRPPMPPQHTDS
ncbi:MAG: hypothetical protein QOE93_1902, partial [Actinomycetota bacterium]|nr:hypothetical protein [Actinomycetota bacterium]